MLHVLLLSLAVAAPAPLQQRTDTTFSVDARGRLDLENHNGDIRVATWDRNAVRVRADHRADTRIGIDNVGSIVRIEAEHRSGPQNVQYDITVPRTFSITVDAHNGSVVLDDVGGEVEVENFNGSIILRGGSRRIDLESVSGEIIVDGARGSINAETVNQSVRITRSTGDIKAETVNGSVHLSDVEADNVVAETVNGGIRFTGAIRPRGRYALSSHNGGITMTVPERTNASFTIVTHNGSIETDFPVEIRDFQSRRRMSFRLGDGSASVELQSFSGSVQLRRPGAR